VVGDISLNKQYSVGSHYSSFEVGFKGWDARKTQRYDRETFNLSGPPMSQFLSSFQDNNYYFGNYTYGPVTDFQKILAAVQPGGTTPNAVYNLRNAFDISERIWAGYAMNTISFGPLRLQAGVRIESTQDSLLANKLNFDPTTGNFIPPGVPQTAHNSYIDVFPSVQAQYRFGSDTILALLTGWVLPGRTLGMLRLILLMTPHPIQNFPKAIPTSNQPTRRTLMLCWSAI
jgi:hypothetical protein